MCSLVGRYDNPIPTQFLALTDCLEIPALHSTWQAERLVLNEGTRTNKEGNAFSLPLESASPPRQSFYLPLIEDRGHTTQYMTGEKTWSSLLFLFRLFNSRESYTKSQTIQHGCLPSLLGDGGIGIEVVYGEEKNILSLAD
jgi:hypothetical protein